MKKFETRYDVIGTAALKADITESRVQGAIIDFPLPREKSPRHAAPAHARHTSERSMGFVQDLRQGSALGKSFGRIAPWQAASAGIVLSAAAFATIFIGM